MSLVALIVFVTAAIGAIVMPGLPPELAVLMPYVAACLGLIALWIAAGLVQRGLGRLFRYVKPRPAIVVDGSNVMHWRDDVPSVATLKLVLADLDQRGFAPLVFFDANVAYKLWGRAMMHRDIAQKLGLARSQVVIAPSRTPADPLLIAQAIKSKVRIVSNDRFMDWRAAFPQIMGKGFLVPGRVRGEQVELRFAAREEA